MLTSLQLRNFQRHASRTLSLDPGITTIIGPTDAGKSAVIRALRWLCCNQPAGTDFRRHGQKFVGVRVGVGSKHSVTRSKGGKKGNLYQLDERELVSFGKGKVPDEVASRLRISEDLTFQQQHEAPFWFALGPSEVAQRLNKVVDLSLLDKLESEIASRLRQGKARVEVRTADLAAAREKRDQRKHAPEFHAEAEALVELSVASSRADLAAGELSAQLVQAEQILAEAKREVPDLSDVDALYQSWAEQEEEHTALASLVRRLADATVDIKARRLRAERAEHTFHHQTKGQTCPLCHQNLP